MNYEKWFADNSCSLSGKRVALTGNTGGIGNELCRHLLRLGAELVLVDRNPTKAQSLEQELKSEFCSARIVRIKADLEDIDSVKTACGELVALDIDVFIHNAGAYSIPRHKCSTGYDNVFQINFISPYYMIMELLPHLRNKNGKVAVMGSIAHRYSVTDANDIDFSLRKQASLVYGNAKRYLMFALDELFKHEEKVSFSIVHPGITFTNITAHYPKLIFAIIKHPMKVIFMKPKKAALCVIKGIANPSGSGYWIGPRLFDVWGSPKKKKLNSCTSNEQERIYEIAKIIYSKIKLAEAKNATH